MTDLSYKTPENLEVVSPRSIPIPIVSSAKAVANFRGPLIDEEKDEDMDEMSESYTCVISHLGSNVVEKRMYFVDKLRGVVGDWCGDARGTNGSGVRVFSASAVNVGDVSREFWTADFLSTCSLCKKQLHGLEISMYRGDKAFYSSECRDKHIRSDD